MKWYKPYSENPNRGSTTPLTTPWIISDVAVDGYLPISDEGLGFLISTMSSINETEAHIVQVENGGTGAEPSFTYTDSLLTRVDYSDGSFKILSYVDGFLVQVDYTSGSTTKRKTLIYSGATLVNIEETIL